MTNGRRNLVVGALTVGAIMGASACASAPAIDAPAMVRTTWSNSAGPAVQLAPGAKPWCGAFALMPYGLAGTDYPCDPGVYSHAVNGVTLTVRTRLDVDLSGEARGKDRDDSLLSSLAVECDDAGGEMVVHVDGANVVAAAECEDVDY